MNNASRQLSFHLKFTAVNAKFWDFSPSLLGQCIILSVVIGIRVSMRGTSRPVSDSGPLNVITIVNNTCVTQELDIVLCPK